jgi:hypothetical protein
MALRARQISNRSQESTLSVVVSTAEREPLVSEPAHRVSAARGLAFAVVLAVPFWLALYLLLRLVFR